jgi:hypothetical protein
MQLLNHTPFGAAAYRGVDTLGREHEVVELRTLYRLAQVSPVHDGEVSWFAPTVVDEDAPGLMTEDLYRGEPGCYSVVAKSDLAPYSSCAQAPYPSRAACSPRSPPIGG